MFEFLCEDLASRQSGRGLQSCKATTNKLMVDGFIRSLL